MKLRMSLFVRIFLGFWLVTTAVLGSWMLADEYFQTMPPGEPGHRPPGPPHRFVLRMVYDLQQTPREEIPELLQVAHRRHGVEIYLLDSTGGDILGRDVPDAAVRLANELEGPRRRAFAGGHSRLLLAHEIYRPGEGRIRAVFQFRRPRRILGWLGSSIWLRLGLAVLISGLLCYVLSRLVTNRLKALQFASRRLAEGELDTRLQVRARGGDETDELARDFNTMAEQLQERIEVQKRLLTDVSHELRSPLARLRVALALAQENRERSGDYLRRIEQEVERLEDLVGQLLESRARELPLESHLDLVALLQQLCTDASFEGQPEGKQVTFDSNLEQAVIATSGDLLHRSFENILRNALTHTPDRSQVSVTLAKEHEGYRIEVTDQGPGVPEAALERIFDEFYRVDSARARDTGGYGLGLAIARQGIERHGGRVKASNTGSGLAITVTLPPK